jgi:hypothetical protein
MPGYNTSWMWFLREWVEKERQCPIESNTARKRLWLCFRAGLLAHIETRYPMAGTGVSSHVHCWVISGTRGRGNSEDIETLTECL